MYFEDTWIGRLGRRGRRGAHFNIGLWNCYQSVIDNNGISLAQTMPLRGGTMPLTDL